MLLFITVNKISLKKGVRENASEHMTTYDNYSFWLKNRI